MSRLDTEDEQSVPESVFGAAYVSLLPRFRALRATELAPINVDVRNAAVTGLATAARIAGFRDRIAAELPEVDLEPIMALADYAMALAHAQARFEAALPAKSLAPLVEEATKLREQLLFDVAVLMSRKLVKGDHLRQLRRSVGYENLAVDLEVLGAIFDHHWAEVRGKCAVKEEELRRAAELAQAIRSALHERDRDPAPTVVCANMRARAFTLFVRVYDEARRVVTFLRWHEGDVDKFVPSLYGGRGKARGKARRAA